MPGHDAAPVPGVIPEGAHSHRWRLDFKQSSLGHIARISRHPALDASRRPPLPWHALVPIRFPIQVSQATQEHSSEFLPTASGIRRSASRRTPDVRLSPHPALHERHAGDGHRCSCGRHLPYPDHKWACGLGPRCSPRRFRVLPDPAATLAAALGHVAGFPGLGLLRRLRPAPALQQTVCLPARPQDASTGRDATGTVPVFTCYRSTGEAPSFTPAAPTGTPQTFSVDCPDHPA